VLRWMRRSRATSAGLLPSSRIIRTTAWRWSGVSFGGRPILLPALRVLSSPALVRSRISSRSNSPTSAKHLHEHATGRGGGVHAFSQTPKTGARLIDLLNDADEVAKAASQAIQLPHLHHVTRAELIKKAMKFGTIPATSTSLFLKYTFASIIKEDFDLSPKVLIPGTHPRVTDSHVVVR
jgi:hypothetical protein